MIKFENVTRKENFAKMVEKNEYQVAENGKEIIIYHRLYSDPYIYGLRRISGSEFLFYSKNDEFFSCNFASNGNKITILQGEKIIKNINRTEC